MVPDPDSRVYKWFLLVMVLERYPELRVCWPPLNSRMEHHLARLVWQSYVAICSDRQLPAFCGRDLTEQSFLGRCPSIIGCLDNEVLLLDPFL